MNRRHPDITRFKNNPILTRKDVPYQVATVHNAGIVKQDDRYIMLFRSHLQNGRSIIGRADSEDGFSFTVHPKPFLVPSADNVFGEDEALGVEDLRICPVEGEYLLTYSAYSRHGVRIALARTRDFEKVERIALITQADLRNVVIFPEKFGDRYVRLDRAHSEISPWSIWISYSPDLVHWGDSRLIMKPVAYHLDEMKIGPDAPPFKTDKGWIVLTHGVGPMRRYCIGTMLLDLENPAKVIVRLDEPLLAPLEKEREGYVPNVVYTCGAIFHNSDLVIPNGMSDITSGIATVRVSELIDCMCASP